MCKGCTEGDVRLLEGVNKLEGRVEVCKHNVWGTVCHYGWNKLDATVACRQLGFSVTGNNKDELILIILVHFLVI